MQLSQIYIYPIKSLGGISVTEAHLTLRGLAHDRRFMLTLLDGTFLTQRTIPEMALLKVSINGDQLKVQHRQIPEDVLTLPLQPTEFIKEQPTEVWGHACTGSVLPSTINDWFSQKLKTPCQLIYMTDDSLRPLEAKHRKSGEIVSFADGYPYLLLGQAAMDDLNQRLEKPVSIDRFRANLIFTGGVPHVEDSWKNFKIGQMAFRAVKPCARCQVPNIQQTTAEIGKEPNRTLAGYRRLAKNKIYFGMNVCWEKELSEGEFIVKVGDALCVV
ncbi:MAG: MOSC N-terminal beta barrel domain-containing protein [Bacteroidota bacterium]